MTDDDKALVEQLEALAVNSEGQDDWLVMSDAADRIEALSAENERLREALGWLLNDSRFVVQVGGNPNVVPQMIAEARAALGETK
jgi:hypothetical protein